MTREEIIDTVVLWLEGKEFTANVEHHFSESTLQDGNETVLRYDIESVFLKDPLSSPGCGAVCCIAGFIDAIYAGFKHGRVNNNWFYVQRRVLAVLDLDSDAIMIAMFDPEAAQKAEVDPTPENTIQALRAWQAMGYPTTSVHDSHVNPWYEVNDSKLTPINEPSSYKEKTDDQKKT